MAQNFTTFTPIEEAEPSPAPRFTTFTPIEEKTSTTAPAKKGQPTKESMLGVKDLADTLTQLKATTSQLVPGTPMHRDNLVSIAEAEKALANSGVPIPAAPEVKPNIGKYLTKAEWDAAKPPPAKAPPPVQKQARAKPAFSLLNNDSLGDIDEIKSRTDTRSVLEKAPALPPAPAQTAVNLGGVSPQYVDSLQAQLNALPAAQRNFVLQQAIKANPDNVKGRALRLIAERYAAMDRVESPTLQKLDPRLEAVKARIAQKYPERAERYPELIEQDAKKAILAGQLEDKYGQVTPDVVGEQADIAAKARAKELENAGFLRRVGAGAASELTKSGLGITNIYADALESAGLIRPNIGKDLTNQRRIEEAKVGAIPQGEGIFEKSAQGAMTSLATQAPLMVLSTLTGTSAPILAQAFIQQLGDSYGESKAAGLSGKAAFARAMPMATAEVFFERLGMTKALAGLKAYVAKHGPQSVYKYMAEAIAKEVPSELATTLTQYGIDVLPEVGLNKNPNLAGLYGQLEETLRQTILQAGVTSATTVGGVKAAQKSKEALQKFLPEQRKGYVQDKSYEGLASLIAQDKGFDFTSFFRGKQGLGKSEGKVDTGPEGPAMGEGPINTAGAKAEPAMGEGQINATGAKAEPAMGEGQIDTTDKRVEPRFTTFTPIEEATTPAAPIVTPAPAAKAAAAPADVEAIAEQLRSNGVPSALAQKMAEKQVAEQTQGAVNATGTEPPPSGGSAGVVSESVAGEPAGGLETPARDGVVPAEPDAGVTATGEVSQSAAIEQKIDALRMKMGRLIEEYNRLDDAAQKSAFDAPKFDAVIAQRTQVFKEFEAVSEQIDALRKSTETAETPAEIQPTVAKTGPFVRKQMEAQTPTTSTPFSTEGAPASVTTPTETKQAKTQRKQAPAATGRKDVHTVAQGAEGKWDHTVNGAVVNSYDTKRQATAASLLAKAEKAGDPANIAQRQKAFDDAMNPNPRGKPPLIIPLDETPTAETETTEVVEDDAQAKADADAQAKEDADMAAYDAKVAKVEGIARTNAQSAFDEVGDYDGDIDAAVDAYRQNTYDTLVEEGLKEDPRYDRLSDAADRAFNAQVEKLRAEKAAKEPKTEAKAPSATDALAAETQEKLQELEDLLGNYNTNPDQFSARTSAKNIARMAKDPAQPKAVRERAKEILADEIDSKDLSSKANSAPPDTAFSKFTTAAQAISHILRTGTKFEKALASRLRGFVQGVKFVVVEKDQPLPEGLAKRTAQWDRSIAMYVESKGERTIYVRGKSFGTSHGISNEPVLHELLHAATARRIRLAMKAIKEGANLDSPLVQAALALQRTMENADTSLRELARKGEMSQELEHLAKAGKAFTDLNEFVSYGITNKDMQDHLINTVGVEGDTHLFTKFVDSIRRMFGMGLDNVNALSDLILATDQLLRAREIGTTEEVGTFSATGPNEAQKELNKNINKAIKKVATSRNGNELGDATANLAKFRDPRYLWGEIKGAWNALGYDARSRVSHFYDSEGLAYAGPGDLISGLKDTHEAIQKMSGSVQTYLRGTANMADEIVDFYRAEPKKRQLFEDLVNATTLAGYDPSNPRNTVRNAKLDTAYLALGAKGQKVYQRLRDYYRAMNAVKQHLLEENLSKLELSDEARRKLLSDIRLLFETDKIEPYFPLARFGDFILETGKTSARATYRFDSMMERDRAAREYAAGQGKTVDQLKSDGELKISNDSNGKTLRANIEATSELLKKSYAAIDTASVTDPYLKQNLKDNLYQAYLAAMPENSVRKMFVHRKGTPGFSSDILRAVNDSGSRMARAFAKLEHAGDIRRGIELSRRQLEGQEQYTPFVKRMEEMAAEALQPSVPTDAEKWIDNVANTIVKLSFLRNLTSWSSAIMQPMDIVMKGVPVLTGNHGPKAMVELSKMMKLHNQYGVVEKMPNGSARFRPPSIEFAKGLSPQERQAVRDMVDMYGVTKDTLANDVFSQAKEPAIKVHSKAYEAGKDAVDTLILGGLMHHTERLSREVIALTSFRLHLAELQKASPGNPMNYHEAVKAAVQETNEVLGNYNANNRPLMMRGAGGRLVTMYKFFPLLTTKLLVSNFLRMLPMFNKQGKAAAATKFFGVLGTHALLGGLVALPAFSLAMKVLQAAWEEWQKDPDAPDEMRDIDYETWWRTEWLPKYFGNPELARIAEYGLLNKLTGFDISSRISLNDLWFRDPQPGKTLNETIMNWGQVIGGAAVSTAIGAAQGIQLMSQGEYERGLEKLTPASISKLLIARRFAKEGIQTTQGAQLVEKGKVPTSEIVGQAIGYAPARISEAQTIAFKEQAAEKVITRERQNIMGTLKDSFRKSIDFNRPDINERFDKIFQDTLDKAVDFSLRYPEQEIKDAEINKAIEDELKKVIETEMGSGIRMTEKNATLAIPSIDKAENALAPYKK